MIESIAKFFRVYAIAGRCWFEGDTWRNSVIYASSVVYGFRKVCK